jgi:hypothetical protein
VIIQKIAILLQYLNPHLPLPRKQTRRKRAKERILFKMKGIFYNSNGFRDPKKHKFVSDLTKENDLSFVAILESCRCDFMPRFLKNLCGGRDFLWHSKAPHGRSGRILLGVDQQMLDIGLIDEGDFYIKF